MVRMLVRGSFRRQRPVQAYGNNWAASPACCMPWPPGCEVWVWQDFRAIYFVSRCDANSPWPVGCLSASLSDGCLGPAPHIDVESSEDAKCFQLKLSSALPFSIQHGTTPYNTSRTACCGVAWTLMASCGAALEPKQTPVRAAASQAAKMIPFAR